VSRGLWQDHSRPGPVDDHHRRCSRDFLELPTGSGGSHSGEAGPTLLPKPMNPFLSLRNPDAVRAAGPIQQEVRWDARRSISPMTGEE